MTRQLDLALYTAPTGTRLDARTNHASDTSASWNLQGCERLAGQLPLPLPAAFRLTDTPDTLHEQLNDGAGILWEGRLENPTLTDQGSTLEALGYSRALTDLPYTALWSTTDVSEWRAVERAENGVSEPGRFTFSNEGGAIYIAPNKGDSFDATNVGYMAYRMPNSSSRDIIGASMDYEVFLPSSSWELRIVRTNTTFGIAANLRVEVGAGALQRGSFNDTVTASQGIGIEVVYNAAAAVFAGETGTAYIRVTNVHIVTSTTNRINTTLTVNRAAGANVTATVGSTARMYVGQVLQIRAPAGITLSESVTVLSIGGATTFNATFVNSYLIGHAVQAHVVYADEIASDLAADISATNTTQLSSSTALIQSPGRDLLDAQWLDQYGADVLADLVQRGDTAVPPRRWVWSVEVGRLLRFAPLGDGGRTWYVDAAGITVQLSRENLFNDAYAVYEDPSGWPLRTAVNPSVTSVARYGLTRRQVVSVSGSNALQAAAARDTAITQGAFPPPKVQVNFEAVYDAGGARWALYLIRPGDTLFIRNLPPTLSTTVDQIRSFVIARVEYHLDDDTIAVEPMDPLPTLEAALAG